MIAYIIQPLCHISGTEDVIRDLQKQYPKIKEFRYYKGGTYSNQDLKEADIVFIRPHSENVFEINLDKLTRGVRKELASVIGIKEVRGIYKRSTYQNYGSYSISGIGIDRGTLKYQNSKWKFTTSETTKILSRLRTVMLTSDITEVERLRLSLSIVHTKVETNPWDNPEEKPTTKDSTLEDRVNILTDICTTLRKELDECRQKYQEDIKKVRGEIKSLEDAISRVGKTAWQTYNPLNDTYECVPPTKKYWEAFAEPNKELLLIKKNK